MKKLVGFIYILLILSISISGVSVFQEVKEAKTTNMGEGNQEIEIGLADEKIEVEEFGEILKRAADYENIIISTITLNEDKKMTIYTTDLSQNGAVKLKSGTMKQKNKNEYIADKKSDDPNQIGVIHKISSNMDITIKGMESISELGVEGNYNINTEDYDIGNNLVSYLEDNGLRADIIGYEKHAGVDKTAYIIKDMVQSGGILFVILLFTVLEYSIRKFREVYILNIFGYSTMKIVLKRAVDILKTLSIGALIAYPIMGIIYYVFNKTNFLLDISLAYILINIVFILLFTVFVSIIILIYMETENKLQNYKGNNRFELMKYAQYVLKGIFVVLLITAIVNLKGNMDRVEKEMETAEIWNKVQDRYLFYGVAASEMLVPGEKGGVGESLSRLIVDLENEHDAIIISFGNYQKDMNDEYAYNINRIEEGISVEASARGKTILVNKNYFKFNPIETTNGSNVVDRIIEDENTVNLLVPEKLKNEEEDIIKSHKKDYYFWRELEKGNIGADLDSIEEKDIADIDVNIINIKDDQKYFTFDTNMERENGNYIIDDPVVNIYKNNLGANNLAYFSGNLFFKAATDKPYEEIKPLLKKHGLERILSATGSAYNLKAREIEELRSEYRKNMIRVVTLAISGVALIYNLTLIYYEKNKYKLYIKRVHGYSVLKSNRNFILTILLINIVPIVYVYYKGIVSDTKTLVTIASVLIVTEFIITIILNYMLDKRSFNSILKGER